MWIVIKFEKKNFFFLKSILKKKFGKDCEFYIPKLLFQRHTKKKWEKREFNLLGDYLFCFNKKFKDTKTIKTINYVRGLKYVLQGFYQSQNEIVKFIEKCRGSENKDGYISEQFYDLEINSNYKFFSGPFLNFVFKIIKLEKNNIKILIGKYKTTINKKEFLFQPI